MNDQQWMELGRRAVACKHWRWMPGMLVLSTNNYHRPARIEALDGDTYGLTVVPHADGPVFASHHEYGVAGEFPRGSTIPDLRDPATLGCLLVLVREALGEPLLYVEPEIDEVEGTAWYAWSAGKWRSCSRGSHPAEAAALVATLEGAGGER